MQTSTFTERHLIPHPASGPDRNGLNVSIIAISVVPVRPDSAMNKVLAALALNSAVPVINRKNRLLWTMGERDMLISPKLHPEDPASTTRLSSKSAIADARDAFERTGQMLIPIVDAKDRYTGQCASRTQLLRLDMNLLRPVRVGGLATPLGVYLTSGYYSAGSGAKGLIATGILFGILAHTIDWLQLITLSGVITLFPTAFASPSNSLMLFQVLFMLVGLLTMLRLTPMSGLHAAEHMTINALESDLEITEENVRAQPRVHLRCGTNLMVLFGGIQISGIALMTIYEQISTTGVILYSLIWAFLIFKFWMPAGLWLQQHFTTRKPSPAQLASGVAAGRELLEKFEMRPHPQPNFWRKIWGAGFVHILLSFMATTTLISWLLGLLASGSGG